MSDRDVKEKTEETSKTVDDSSTSKKKQQATFSSKKFSDSELGHKIQIIRRKLTPKVLKGHHRLVAEKDALNWSLGAVRLGVVADACSTTILQPNFPFIARPGTHPDSFDNTDPFGVTSATYFLPMTALLGAAITSVFIGSLSDKIGRKPCMLACVGVSVIGTIVKFLVRDNFWPFCIANFFNGLFGASLPVSLAYVSDVHPNRKKKDAEIGTLIGFNMIGMSGGGIAAILMEEQGLFEPLLVGAALNFVAAVGIYLFMIESDSKFHFEEDVDDDDLEAPDHFNWSLFWNVNVGALLDNIGSSGLYPLALAPLAFETFYTDFLEVGEEPVMSDVAYKWIAVMVALMVIPGAVLSQPLYERIGPAGGCVFGNSVTAVGIFGCLYICRIEPPTNGTLSGFVILLYLIFPLTVLSQLSTGPMLDRLSPLDRKGFSQGVNVTIMNFANAVSPWIFGIFADEAGTFAMLWTTIGISILAALVNMPLMFAPQLKAKEKVDYQQAMGLEDHELVERALQGEWVPARFLMDLNEARMRSGKPFLIPPVHSYEEDKPRLLELQKHAKEDFEFLRMRAYEWLADMDTPEKREETVGQIRKAVPSQAEIDKAAEDTGKWFAEYMKDVGHFMDGGSPSVHKQMIMKAFPPINTDHEITTENVEKTILRWIAIANDYIEGENKGRATRAFRNSVVLS